MTLVPDHIEGRGKGVRKWKGHLVETVSGEIVAIHGNSLSASKHAAQINSMARAQVVKRNHDWVEVEVRLVKREPPHAR